MTPAEIRAARKAFGMTQAQFARAIGYGHLARVHELEVGKHPASACVVRLIQAYLDGYRPPDWPQICRSQVKRSGRSAT